MHFFRYRDGRLHCEDVDLARVANEFGTPTYVYSAGTILDHYSRLDAALAPVDHLICYAVKANSNRAILKLLADAGAGFDIVSGGELFRVLAAGGDPAQVHIRGSRQIERRNRIRARTRRLQLQRRERSGTRVRSSASPAQKICVRQSRCASIPMSIPHTHEYISTGSHENKFGIALDHSRGRLRARRRNAQHRYRRRADAHRFANHRGEAVRERDRKGGADSYAS